MLQSENNFIVINDLAFDWLKPKVVMTNTETVRSSVLEERRKKLRSMTGSQQRRLSNLLMALNHGDFSFSSAYHGSLFTPPHPPLPNSLFACHLSLLSRSLLQSAACLCCSSIIWSLSTRSSALCTISLIKLRWQGLEHAADAAGAFALHFVPARQDFYLKTSFHVIVQMFNKICL